MIDPSSGLPDARSRRVLAVTVALWVVAGVGSSLWLVDRLWSGSVDFAHHYALIRYLAEFLVLPDEGDPALLSMSIYPPATHVLGAIMGRFVGSTLLGMNLTALLALAALWGGFAWWFTHLPARAFGPFAITLAVLIGLAANFGLELHGDELVSNYLYSQLVAQGLAVCLIAFVVRSQTSGDSSRHAWTLAVATPLVGSLHLLPGLSLLATFCMIVVFDAVSRPRHALAIGLRGLGWAVAALIATVLSPAFQAFRLLSENDGSLDLHYIGSIGALVVLAVLVLALSAGLGLWWMWRARRRTAGEWGAVKMLAAYGMGLALLCLVQVVALSLGQGSAYACRKYAFALHVTLCLDVAVAIGMMVGRATPMRLWRVSEWSKVAFPAICVVFVFAVTLSARVQVFSLHSLMETERFATDYQRLVLEQIDGKYTYAVGIRGLTNVMNYMVSIGTLRAPAEPNGMDVLNGRPISDRKSVAYLITSPGSDSDAPECRKHRATSALVVIDAGCFYAEKSRCEPRVDFTDTGHVPTDALEGFSAPWTAGRWSESTKARYRCIVGTPTPTRARLAAYGYVKQGHAQRMSVSVNGAPAVQAVFTTEGEEKFIDIPLPAAVDGVYTFDFVFPDAVSPFALGVSPDRRTLAVGVRSLSFE